MLCVRSLGKSVSDSKEMGFRHGAILQWVQVRACEVIGALSYNSNLSETPPSSATAYNIIAADSLEKFQEALGFGRSMAPAEILWALKAR